MLGDGVYCSLTKAFPKYVKTAFRLLVYTGKTYKCTKQDDDRRVGGVNKDPNLRWQKDYASCWVPPQSLELNPSGLEENCIRSRNQIRILGIAKGWDLLAPNVQALTTNTEGANTNTLSDSEKKVLGRMRREVGESWTMIQVPGKSQLVLDVSARDGSIILWPRPKHGKESKDNQMFKIWHDFTIRSKLDPEKKICINKDGKTLHLAADESDETNKFRLKAYEGNALKNNNYSCDSSLYITAEIFKKGSSVVALDNSDKKMWWFTK